MPTASGHTTAIRAQKVIDTKVYDPAGSKIGEIEDLVLDKTSSQVMFAVVGFGGFLGIGEKYHPVPWSLLNFDESRDGYVVNLTKEQLQAAPHDTLAELTRDDGRTFRDRAFAHYKTRPYWS